MQITTPTIVTVSSGNALPTATVLGNSGRTIPTTVIDNDTIGNLETGTFTPCPLASFSMSGIYLRTNL